MHRRKKLGQSVHVKKRAIERFGITLNRDNLKEMVHMVQRQFGIFVLKISGSKTSWAIPYKNKKFYVVYDKNTKNIATVMPLEYAVSDLLKDVETELAPLAALKLSIDRNELDNIERKINLAADLLKERIKQ